MIEILIYSDGAGASVIEASDDEETGLLSYESSTYAMDEANYVFWKIIQRVRS
jgi:3-oxoacyl-[acyl-carrier-protein] synthase-3